LGHKLKIGDRKLANTSNWKGTEHKAAKLFPGGRRRTRVGGGTYALIADDVIWGPEVQIGDKVFKYPLITLDGHRVPPLFIECKKRTAISTVSEFKKAESKYRPLYKGVEGGDRPAELVAVFHVKNDHRQYVLVSDSFFKELLRCWILEHNIFNPEPPDRQASDENGE
jgi:hypothetical protein